MSQDPSPTPRIAREVFRTPVHEEIRDSFLAYSLSVITSRAIPDVRDGLKPVQRRILYGMYERGLRPDRPHTKSAQVVGTVMGTFHPHGDAAIYDALVRMTQDFAMRVVLVDGHGNFGSLDDPPAAMRYCLAGNTRVRLANGASVAIADLVGEAGERDIDLTLLDRAGRPTEAVKAFNSGVHPTFTLTTESGFSLTGSGNHPVLILTTEDEIVGGRPMLAWRTLEDITPGSYVCLAANAAHEVDENEAASPIGMMLGAWVSDGWVLCPRPGAVMDPQVRPSVLDPLDYAQRVEHRPEDVFIPEVVWRSTAKVKRDFLSACWQASGKLVGHGAPSAVLRTASGRLARELQELLLEFGVVARRRQRGRVHRLVVSGADLAVFARRVGFCDDDSQLALAELVTEQGSIQGAAGAGVPYLRQYLSTAGAGHDRDGVLALLENAPRFEKVSALVESEAEYVYTFRVDSEDHSFLAGGFVNHNSECRMASAAMEMLADIDEGTVDFRDNYDGKHQEPEVLPARLPNLLINGTSGIAVGMATNLAPHNPGEIIAAALHLLENPDATLDDLMALVPAPDFPTGGVIVDAGGIREAYAQGRGSFRIRAKATVGDVSARRRGITITELPYNVGAERFIGRVKDLVNARSLEGISDIKDLSDRKKGLNIVVECKTGVNPAGLLAELYTKTPLEETFAINAVVLVNGRPLTLGLRELLQHYLDHRLEVVVRRTQHRLDRARERAHIVEGLVQALAAIDEVVAVIRRSKSTEEARERLIKTFSLSEIQASHILEMPLRRLTSLEVAKLKDELKQLKAAIKELEAILASPKRQRALIADELREVGDGFASPRRSRVLDAEQADLGGTALELPDDPCVVTLSTSGLVGRQDGPFKGKAGGHDALVASVGSSLRKSVAAVTDRGRLLVVEAGEIPEVAGRNRGAAASEIFDLERGEHIAALLPAPGGAPWCLATESGVLKRLAPDQLATRPGVALISLRDGDRVVGAVEAPDDAEVVLVASDAQVLRTAAAGIRPQGRSAAGVSGMRLGEEARVLALGVIPAGGEGGVHILTVSDGQAAKSSPAGEFPAKGRGTGGVRAMRLRKSETGLVAAAVGAGPFAVHGEGSVTELAAGDAKRDAAGDPLEHPVEVGGAGLLRR